MNDGNEEESCEEEEKSRQEEEVVRSIGVSRNRKKGSSRAAFFFARCPLRASTRASLDIDLRRSEERIAQLRDGFARTPPGPRGSNGSDCFRVRN